MCFLYRQSISIVYESKFKYIYRYFIKIDRCFCGILLSLPLRKCGLKFNFHNFPVFCITSLPLRKCGLKYDRNEGCNQWGQVTSFAEVWIEIGWRPWTLYQPLRHFLCGSVDWNCEDGAIWSRPYGHFLCGSVDWNLVFDNSYINLHLVTSFAEVWIEIRYITETCVTCKSHFLCGSVDWNRR